MCECCKIVPDFEGSIEGEALKKIGSRRLFRSKYGVYYTAVEEKTPGGWLYRDHIKVEKCPACNMVLK